MIEDQDIKSGKTTALISYFWLIGVLIAYLTNTDKKVNSPIFIYVNP